MGRQTKTVTCSACIEAEAAPATTPPPDQRREPQSGGASAQREHDRRRATREKRLRAAHPRLGGLVLALSDDPQSTKAWGRGAEGERKVARLLNTLVPEGIAVLHDRRIPRTKANIDHIAIAPSGIYIVDSKRYTGRVEPRSTGGIL